MREFITLKKLSLHNFATFEQQDIHFKEGFNIIVGETGSGKSLIFDALQLVLGSRADKNLVRTKAPFSCVEAFFSFSGEEVKNYLDSIGFPASSDEIIIKRIVYPIGKTKAFINYQQCNLSILTDFAKRFVDLVGQFENQKLLSSNYQLKLLDHYSQSADILSRYQEKYFKYQSLMSQKRSLEEKIGDQEQRLDYISFQINEIEKVSPALNEEEDLTKQKNILLKKESSEKTINELRDLLDESEKSLLSQLKYLRQILDKNIELFNSIDLESLEEHCSYFDDLSYTINSISLETDEGELETILDRLDSIQKLKRKFGRSIEDVLVTYKNFLDEKNELLNIKDRIQSIDKEISSIKLNLKDLASKLTQNRLKYAKKLSDSLTDSVQMLNMKGAKIEIKLSSLNDFSQTGLDKMDIFAETNPGEGSFPLSKIASGGELSRVLLSLRQSLSSSDTVSIFFFDEVDTGVGGETALKIGKVLKKVSEGSQVIAITHLPQIASQSENLIKVIKETISNDNNLRTVSKIFETIDPKIIKKETKEMIPELQ